MVFLYTNSELSERETKRKIPITIATRTTTKKNALRNKLTMEVKDLYSENYRTEERN